MWSAIDADVSVEDAEQAKGAVIASIPVGRYGEPYEVAAFSAFLCRDDATFINGSIDTMDGGLLPT